LLFKSLVVRNLRVLAEQLEGRIVEPLTPELSELELS
jgi:hypothetical protein